MITEALRSGDTRGSVEERRHGVIMQGAQAGPGDPTVINNSPMVS